MALGSAGALELDVRWNRNTVAELRPAAPSTPFCASTVGVDHDAAAMLVVTPGPTAVATVTYSGVVPAGGVALQPLVMPVMPPEANVYVIAALGKVGALLPRW